MSSPDQEQRPGAKRLASLSAALAHGTEAHYEDASLYDAEYVDQTQDIPWYLTQLAQAKVRGTVLELGSGTGRVTIPLAQAGHQVIGLERMPTMTARLIEKLAVLAPEVRQRVTSLQGDMLEIPLEDQSVDAVVAPFNVLMHLYDWREILACFQECARVLRPGGLFAFDVLQPDLSWLTLDPHKRHAITRFVDPATGKSQFYSTNHDYDPSTQICHIRLYYDDAPRGARKPHPGARPLKVVQLAHRQIYPEEIRSLLDRAGFDSVTLGGDFSSAPLEREHESQAVTARRCDTRRAKH